MDLIKGVVSAISSKEIPEDRFGNTYRLSIKVGEDWIGLGSGKKPDIGVKEGEGWVTLSKGDEIALVVEENNGYLNGQKKTLKITKKNSTPSATSQKSASSSPQKATASPEGNGQRSNGGSVDWAAKDAGAAASASIDKALKYIELRKGEVKTDYATVLSIARDMQGMVKTLAGEIMGKPATPDKSEEAFEKAYTPLTSGMPGKTTQTRTRKPAPVEPDPEDMVDDDIPF